MAVGFVSSTAIQKTMKQRKAEVNAIRKARRRMEENISKRPPFVFCQDGQSGGVLCKQGRQGFCPASLVWKSVCRKDKEDCRINYSALIWTSLTTVAPAVSAPSTVPM